MQKELITDIVEWDCINWWRAIGFWEKIPNDIFCDMNNKKVLDIGGRNGGLSLYWALKGAEVYCTDLRANSFDKARNLHIRYSVDNKVKYRQLDVLQLEEENVYDVITFKSVMGGVGYNDNIENQKRMIKNIYRALKPGGYLFFVENLVGSKPHMWLRQKYRPWGNRWRYLTVDEVKAFLVDFREVNINGYGFLGILGQGKFFDICSKIDMMFDNILKTENKYIVSCVARK